MSADPRDGVLRSWSTPSALSWALANRTQNMLRLGTTSPGQSTRAISLGPVWSAA